MNFPEDLSTPLAAGVKLNAESEQQSKTIPSLDLKKLLVPTDFSENSKKALIYAVRLAQRNDSSLILFHVFESPEFHRQLQQGFCYDSNAEMGKQFVAAMRQSEEKLMTLSGEVQASNIKIETAQRLGIPSEEIIKVAKECAVDLIIIATHSCTDLRYFFLGSTTERVVRRAPCPVLVVRQEERDFVA
jgi:universal stress protein A